MVFGWTKEYKEKYHYDKSASGDLNTEPPKHKDVLRIRE